MIYTLCVEIVEEVDIVTHVYDDDGIYYGQKVDARQRWKLGSIGKSALGYFKVEADAKKIKDAIEKNDPDVAAGRVIVHILKQTVDKIRLYPSYINIAVNMYYPEGCLNGDASGVCMSPDDLVKFTKMSPSDAADMLSEATH